MSEQNVNPVELFGMRVAHVGINAADERDVSWKRQMVQRDECGQ